jgi:hypothetical protein
MTELTPAEWTRPAILGNCAYRRRFLLRRSPDGIEQENHSKLCLVAMQTDIRIMSFHQRKYTIGRLRGDPVSGKDFKRGYIGHLNTFTGELKVDDPIWLEAILLALRATVWGDEAERLPLSRSEKYTLLIRRRRKLYRPSWMERKMGIGRQYEPGKPKPPPKKPPKAKSGPPPGLGPHQQRELEQPGRREARSRRAQPAGDDRVEGGQPRRRDANAQAWKTQA